jgi:polyferredoxin
VARAYAKRPPEPIRGLRHRNFVPPRWADVPLRSLKYVLLALFAMAVASMSTDEIVTFLTGPYGIVADVKMLNLFRDAGPLTIQVCSILIILSVITKNFWCRYLCPYGALMGLAALFSLSRITRDPIACIDCWNSTTSEAVLFDLVPKSNSFSHP